MWLSTRMVLSPAQLSHLSSASLLKERVKTQNDIAQELKVPNMRNFDLH